MDQKGEELYDIIYSNIRFLENRYDQETKNLNTFLFTFIGFLITTSWVLIASCDCSCTKMIFCVSIILFILWALFNYLLLILEKNSYSKLIDDYLRLYQSDIDAIRWSVNKEKKKTVNKKEKALNLCKNISLIMWTLTFIIWLFIYSL